MGGAASSEAVAATSAQAHGELHAYMQRTASQRRTAMEEVEEQRHALHMQALLDPRSPTVGVARTPLQVALGTLRVSSTTAVERVAAQANAQVDPRSPTRGMRRTPVSNVRHTRSMKAARVAHGVVAAKYDDTDADDVELAADSDPITIARLRMRRWRASQQQTQGDEASATAANVVVAATRGTPMRPQSATTPVHVHVDSAPSASLSASSASRIAVLTPVRNDVAAPGGSASRPLSSGKRGTRRMHPALDDKENPMSAGGSGKKAHATFTGTPRAGMAALAPNRLHL